ncbi:unnamed protein product [Caenorhabditis angaria]|uniref:Uncharacterized protein n=1 Tax=Caenorhabditis angaria TaxID=860376 RepID=A0A9P1J0S5_9PELO|nr:unnamed protein product [Caenorhabditis angaria]CAI5454486.1 unnamed protein product [Caenorhabditis angaria]
MFVITGLFLGSVMTVRSVLAAFIAIERCFATYFPVLFYNYRWRCSSSIFIICIILIALTEPLLFFAMLNFKFPRISNCKSFICVAPEGYKLYSATLTSFYGVLNYVFSFFLCWKLIVIYYKNRPSYTDLKKANILSMTDGLSSFIFELLPSIVLRLNFVEFANFGPILTIIRLVGKLFESCIMLYVMRQKKRKSVVAYGIQPHITATNVIE